MGPKVGIYYWVRVGVMIISLIGVLTLMKKLNMPGALLGAGEKVDLCPTRVSSVSVIGQFSIVQEGMKWYRTGDGAERTLLDQVGVEKWFAKYCVVPATPEQPPPDSAPLLTLAYISGLPVTLMVSPEGVFSIKDSHFRSLELLQAITALENLATSTKPAVSKPAN